MARRRRRHRVAPFRAWGMPLTTLLALALCTRQWLLSTAVTAVLVLHLLAVRVTPCRVLTRQRRPCRWRVSGLFRCCDWHRGLKRGLPILVPVRGHLLPLLGWPRPELKPDWRHTDREPRPSETAGPLAALAPNDRRSHRLDKVMFGLVALCVLLVVGALARALLPG